MNRTAGITSLPSRVSAGTYPSLTKAFSEKSRVKAQGDTRIRGLRLFLSKSRTQAWPLLSAYSPGLSPSSNPTLPTASRCWGCCELCLQKSPRVLSRTVVCRDASWKSILWLAGLGNLAHCLCLWKTDPAPGPTPGPGTPHGRHLRYWKSGISETCLIGEFSVP